MATKRRTSSTPFSARAKQAIACRANAAAAHLPKRWKSRVRSWTPAAPATNSPAAASTQSWVVDPNEPQPDRKRSCRPTSTKISPSVPAIFVLRAPKAARSEEHTSELQSLMRISYAVFCLKTKISKHKSQKLASYNIRKPQHILTQRTQHNL